MGILFRRHRTHAPGNRWAWWLFLGLLGSTVGWFWLLGADLRLERKKEPAPQTTAKASSKVKTP